MTKNTTQDTEQNRLKPIERPGFGHLMCSSWKYSILRGGFDRILVSYLTGNMLILHRRNYCGACRTWIASRLTATSGGGKAESGAATLVEPLAGCTAVGSAICLAFCGAFP